MPPAAFYSGPHQCTYASLSSAAAGGLGRPAVDAVAETHLWRCPGATAGPFLYRLLLGCVEAIRSGVTTVCEHNFLNPDPECAFESVRAIQDSGLRSVFARTIMDAGEIVPDCTRETPETAFARIESVLSRHKYAR